MDVVFFSLSLFRSLTSSRKMRVAEYTYTTYACVHLFTFLSSVHLDDDGVYIHIYVHIYVRRKADHKHYFSSYRRIININSIFVCDANRRNLTKLREFASASATFRIESGISAAFIHTSEYTRDGVYGGKTNVHRILYII